MESPKTWDEYRNVCAALKKIGVYGFGLGSGAGNFTGSHILTAFMINNGGGLFNADKKPDCVTPENIEAMEFVLDLVKSGYSDPAGATYTSDNVQAQWKAKKFGFGWDGAGLPAGAVGDVASDLVVGDPLTSPSGKKGGLYFPNNIMMYKNTAEPEGLRGVPDVLLQEHEGAVDEEDRHRPAAAEVDRRHPRVQGQRE